jgi:membrane fusion protein, multidrug efflux system
MWIAGAILLLLTLYLGSGLLRNGSQTDERRIPELGGVPLMQVRVSTLQAESIAREVLAPGRTLAARRVEIRAETAGRVIEVVAPRGGRVTAGQALLVIEAAARPEALAHARAVEVQRKLEYDAAVRLGAQGLRADSQVAEALAAWQQAQQEVRVAELEIERTTLRAPFDGYLHERHVELGDYLAHGAVAAEFLELDPLIVVGDVTELQINRVHVGETGVARLMDGRQLTGRIRYVAPRADPQTRTFRVELEVANPDGAVAAGITATIAIETEQVMAHRVSPALIAIDDDGTFGLKFVDANDNVVRFVEADLVKSAPDAIWLAGLPPTIRLITFGQGFTKPGDRVLVAEEQAAWR